MKVVNTVLFHKALLPLANILCNLNHMSKIIFQQKDKLPIDSKMI